MADDANLPDNHRHDVIVIGASAGGIAALRLILAELPGDLAAAIFIVLHVGADSHLPEVLAHSSTFPVMRANSGDPVRLSQAYVAPSGIHMLLHDGHILLRRGPRENMARPAIDPLFRSAACTYRGRVIGVILSGALNDGTAGLLAVKRCGGIAVVQHPADAAVAEMPLSALRHVDADHVLPASEMPKLFSRLVQEPAGPMLPVPFEIRLETAIAAQEPATMDANEKLGRLSVFTCPECDGALWEIEDGSLLRYRCHVGHSYTGETILSVQSQRAEELLYSLLRADRERAVLAHRMADRWRGQGHTGLAEQLEQRARDYEEDADVIRRLLRVNGAHADDEAEQDRS